MEFGKSVLIYHVNDHATWTKLPVVGHCHILSHACHMSQQEAGRDDSRTKEDNSSTAAGDGENWHAVASDVASESRWPAETREASKSR